MIPAPHPRIYLASRSPRRRELLTQIGVSFETLLFRGSPREDPDVDETPRPGELPIDYVVRVAQAKAEGGRWRMELRRLPEMPVLSADTTVELEGEIFGKPQDEEDARRMLRLFSGRTHRVMTAVAMSYKGNLQQAISVSEVSFRTLDERDIEHYLATGEPFDKAGAYGIQGRAGIFVRELKGSYTGVMGLPVFETAELLRRFGYRL